mmetsp:Transcript_31163/g.78990  ORF Transcript_31163/g.78990 Transcript_31163/m.78990 type:complete len:260 (-) Transcript_31163:2044-2823(-)
MRSSAMCPCMCCPGRPAGAVVGRALIDSCRPSMPTPMLGCRESMPAVLSARAASWASVAPYIDIPRTRPNLGSSFEASAPPLSPALADNRSDPAVAGLVDAILMFSCISCCLCLTSSSIWLVLADSSRMCARSAATSAAIFLRSRSRSPRIFFFSRRSLCSRTWVSDRRLASSSFWDVTICTIRSLRLSIASAFSSSRTGLLLPRPSSWLRGMPRSWPVLPTGLRCAISSSPPEPPTSMFLPFSLPEPMLPPDISLLTA